MFLKIQSQLDIDKKIEMERNKTKQNDSVHVYHQSTCTLLKNNFSSTLQHGLRRSHTVRHHHKWSDMLEHHRTDILLRNSRTQSNTVVHMTTHGRTRSHKIYSYSTQSHRRPYMVEHGRIDDRTWSHMVAHGRTDDRIWSHMVTQKILSRQNGQPSMFHNKETTG